MKKQEEFNLNFIGTYILNQIITAEKTVENAEEINLITRTVIEAATEVHRFLGPGLLESAYEACLAFELKERGLTVARQVELPFYYKEMPVDIGYRLDLLVNDTVIIEVKAINTVALIHHAQLSSYLKLSGCKLGILINFNVIILEDGITRIVNHF